MQARQAKTTRAREDGYITAQHEATCTQFKSERARQGNVCDDKILKPERIGTAKSQLEKRGERVERVTGSKDITSLKKKHELNAAKKPQHWPEESRSEAIRGCMSNEPSMPRCAPEHSPSWSSRKPRCGNQRCSSSS